MEEMKKRFDEYFKGNIDENSYLHINTVYVRYFIQSEIDLAVSKERERIVEMIEKEIDRIKNGDIKWVGLRKALKLIQNERTI